MSCMKAAAKAEAEAVAEAGAESGAEAVAEAGAVAEAVAEAGAEAGAEAEAEAGAEAEAEAGAGAEGVAPTQVWWDINRCPLPDDVDVGRFRPCIKRALEEKLGYAGPLTITAIGILTDVPPNFLKEVYSSGIGIYHVPRDIVDITATMLYWIWANPPPANVMLISTRANFSRTLDVLHEYEYNIVRSLSPEAPSASTSTSIWECLLASLLAGGLEDRSSETGESALRCEQCGVTLQGIENFTTHLKSGEHLHNARYYRKKG
ncbi:PREDICTED: uncharacterized protein LOC104738627 isoform X2 [Camelina sativa]|uniref:Uncharacterized protein LOC104738627 isoform X2 n=1 Tax=Camelina sativa TaxID=90675 RepID=A0ABM1QX42_CAMSA|nr:PREDICTED: uncharacterized protein LOC104738627 isoform X2 [Camelina sativa]